MDLNEVKIGQAVRWKDHRSDPEYYGIICTINDREKAVTISYTDSKTYAARLCDLELAPIGVI